MAQQLEAPFRWTPVEAATMTREGSGSAASSQSSAPVAGGTTEVCTSCMVCLADFTKGEWCRRLPCRHVFHQGCIDEWLTRANSCPICKGPATKEGSAQA